MEKEIFRHDSVAKLSSPKQLSNLLVVVRLRGWVVLLSMVVIILSVLIWSVMGQIPIIVTGNGILLSPNGQFSINSPEGGVVKEIFVKIDQEVPRGSPLVALSTGVVISAPRDGKIFQMSVSSGEYVRVGEVLLWFESKICPDDLVMYGFVSTAVGERIKEGMFATMDLGAVDAQKYGQVVGRVKHVSPYAVSSTFNQLKVIPSAKLREDLTKGSSVELIIIQPQLNPDNPSGLAWSFGQGPPHTLTPGAMGTARVTIENKRPISYLIPFKS